MAVPINATDMARKPGAMRYGGCDSAIRIKIRGLVVTES